MEKCTAVFVIFVDDVRHKMQKFVVEQQFSIEAFKMLKNNVFEKVTAAFL